eukprot:11180774-Lingulodinium_polyedra.AAC.1
MRALRVVLAAVGPPAPEPSLGRPLEPPAAAARPPEQQSAAPKRSAAEALEEMVDGVADQDMEDDA